MNPDNEEQADGGCAPDPEKSNEPLLDATVVVPIVGEHIGEVGVSFTNRYSSPLCNVVLTIEADESVFGLVPRTKDGGYVLSEVPPGKTESRSFAVRPIRAMVGKSYLAKALATYRPPRKEDAAKKGRASAAAEQEPALRTLPKPFKLEVQARPEVYMAIGAVEELRSALIERVKKWTEEGHKVHDQMGSPALPSSPSSEPLQMALSAATFETVLGMVELGTRLFAGRPPNAGSTKPAAGQSTAAAASGGGDGAGQPAKARSATAPGK